MTLMCMQSNRMSNISDESEWCWYYVILCQDVWTHNQRSKTLSCFHHQQSHMLGKYKNKSSLEATRIIGLYFSGRRRVERTWVAQIWRRPLVSHLNVGLWIHLPRIWIKQTHKLPSKPLQPAVSMNTLIWLTGEIRINVQKNKLLLEDI